MKNPPRLILCEEWKPIAGFAGYEVSSHGRVCSWRVAGGKGGTSDVGRLLKPYSKSGYCYVNLRRDGKTVACAVHRLVLEAFVGPCPPGMEARHFPDATRSNNALRNLSWGTKEENAADKQVHGTVLRGERHNMARMSEAQAAEVKRRLRQGERPVTIARDMALTYPQVWQVACGKTWRHVS